MYMSNVRVCVDVVGGDEKPQVVLDGIEAALTADPDIEVLSAGPAEIVNPFAAFFRIPETSAHSPSNSSFFRFMEVKRSFKYLS